MPKKSWWRSLTLQSIAITALGIFLPKYAPAIPGIIGDAATIAGLIGSVIGRLRVIEQVTFTPEKQ